MPVPVFRPAIAAALAALAVVASASSGCGGERRPGDDASPGAVSDRPADRAARDVPPDTSRSGPAFLAIYRDGPLDELRVVRATDGALVVAGEGDFPTGTRVTIALLRRTAGGGLEPVASTRAPVDLGHFMGAPLSPVSGPPPPGLHVLRVTVPFGPAEQDPAVLRATDQGRRYRGSGVHTRGDVGVVFETTLEVPL